MSDQSMVEMQQRGEAAEAAIKAAIASERRRCIDRVLTYAALIRPYPSNRRKQRRWATCFRKWARNDIVEHAGDRAQSP